MANLFGGGNGDYDYTSANSPHKGKTAPNVNTAVAITLRSGCFDQVFGGGNNATINAPGSTTITINNATSGDQLYWDKVNPADASEALRPLATHYINDLDLTTTYQFGRVFGGNNKVDMVIQPQWNLQKGSIQYLYSGGNEGGMTSGSGIALTVSGSDMRVYNVFGGCRKANVSMKARTVITDGTIFNVYGGNDISGTVRGGTDVDIRHTILGDVYGGGNGSYYYTTSAAKAALSDYFQLYPTTGFTEHIDALSAYIPNQRQTAIHITGTSANRTYINGRVFCGGNSATVTSVVEGTGTSAQSTLTLGSYVTAGSVFLGSNGENLIRDAISSLPAAMAHYSSDGEIDLTTQAHMNKYMDAVAMNIWPTVQFDNDYADWTTQIGSFYCGGNVGSMTGNGTMTQNFNKKIVVYDKVVGGSNTADVAYEENVNCAYDGGLTGTPGTGNKKVVLNFNGLKLEPRLLNKTREGFSLDWHIDDGETNLDTTDDRLVGGNIYGGCYTSGHVNGNVEINLNATTCYKTDVLSDDGTEGNSGIPLDQQGDDPFGSALNVFGGGFGSAAEIRGNTVINVNGGYSFQVFGGGEEGNVTGNCTVNLNGGEVEYLYGGGFEGPVGGNTLVNLGGGL